MPDSIASLRRAAVAVFIDDVRAITGAQDAPDADALQRIAAQLKMLAARTELFTDAAFPASATHGSETLYLLSEDADGRNALYLYRPAPGFTTPPHNHTTWAVIAGVDGIEPNTVWRRVDDGSAHGKAALEVEHGFDVGPGDSAWFTGADIHSIAIGGDRPITHLHLYGRTLMDLPERVDFDVAAATWRVQTEKPVLTTSPDNAVSPKS